MQTSSAACFLLSCCIVWYIRLLFPKSCMRNYFINKLGIWLLFNLYAYVFAIKPWRFYPKTFGVLYQNIKGFL